jgi:NAD(P)-dependent dehydrogenase (short-subunit alcohol dehydrogenase family)
MSSKKTIVVTGASSGFGRLSANALARSGHTVYASMRETKGRNAPQVADVEKFAKDNGVDLRALELDVNSQESVDAGIAQIVATHGRLDVIVHNAGHMVFGPAEAFTPEQLAELYDINVLSTQRVNRAALPQLRKQREGLLVWVSSSSSAGGTPPYLSPYFAAKAGMDALAVQYARELSRWGDRDVDRRAGGVYAWDQPFCACGTTPGTRSESLITRRGLQKVWARRYKEPSQQLCHPTPTCQPSRTPLPQLWTHRSANGRLGSTSIRQKMVPQ